MKLTLFALLVAIFVVVPSWAYNAEEDANKDLTDDQIAYFEAIEAGDFDAVKDWILNKEMPINTRDHDHRTGLQRAIVFDQVEIGLWLMEQDIDVVLVDNTYLDPLHTAAKFDRHEIVQAILDHGIHPNKKNKDGLMPIHRAAMGKTPDAAKTMAIIYKAGISIDERDEKGKTALNYAIAAGNTDSIDFLLAKGASMYYLSKKEQKKLHHLAPYIHHEL